MFPRFRAVCKSWRSSIPPFKNLLQLPLELSVAFGKDGEYTHSGGFTVIESAVYHLAPPTDDDPRKEDLTFEILKLEAHKKQWVKLEAQALDDRILVLGDDGWYSLSARDFPGVEGKCIYFNKALHRKSYKCNELKNMFREVAVYNLGSGPVLQLTDIPSSNNIFCPRPTWRWRDTP
ncbi:hypothetical protein ACFX12_026935 [Malus domestica]